MAISVISGMAIAVVFLIIAAVGAFSYKKNQKTVVAVRLDLEVIVILDDRLDIVLRAVIKEGAEQLARLTRRADDKSLSVLFYEALGHSRITLEVGEIALGNQAIEIFESYEIFCNYNKVVCTQDERV